MYSTFARSESRSTLYHQLMHGDDGQVIDGKYQLGAVLGSGGFGTVYKAWQADLERFVALKLLRATAPDESGLRRFEREAKALNAIRHKNISAFYGFGLAQDSYYIAMELVQGASLDKLIAPGAISPQQAVNVACQILDALGAAHNAGVVHRDLKPSNVLLRDGDIDRPAKVIDFGLVKLMPGYGMSAQKLTETGIALGTCNYMSPEQCTGQAEVDNRADLYAAGCILFEMLTGFAPFDATDEIEIMVMHVNAPPPSLGAFFEPSAGVRELDAILQKVLNKKPELRYQTARDFRDALLGISEAELREIEPVLVEDAVAANVKKQSNPSIAQKKANDWQSGRKRLALGVLAIALVTVGALTVMSLNANKSEKEKMNASRTLTADKPREWNVVVASLTLNELQEKRANFAKSPEPEARRNFYWVVATKERAAHQFEAAIKDIRTLNLLLHDLGRDRDTLVHRVFIGECGLSGELPNALWLPDVQEGIGIADRTNAPQSGARLRLLVVNTIRHRLNDKSVAQARPLLEGAVRDEKAAIASGEKFNLLTRGQTELDSAAFYFDVNDKREALLHVTRATRDMQAAPDGLSTSQQYILSRFCSEFAPQLPAKLIKDAQKLLDASDTVDAEVINAKAACALQLKQALKAKKLVNK